MSTPTPVPVPTQVRRPWRTTLRTVVQQLFGWILAAGVVLPLVLAAVQEELGDVIPDRTMGWLVAAVGVAVALSAAAARIMAIPQVEAFLRKHRLLSGLAADKPAADTGYQPRHARDETGAVDREIALLILGSTAALAMLAVILIATR